MGDGLEKMGGHFSGYGVGGGAEWFGWRFTGLARANLISLGRFKIVENSTVWGSEAGLCLVNASSNETARIRWSASLTREGEYMTQAEIVILANSVKHGQHCVAGKCTTTGAWIRPVSNAQGAELSHEQAKCQNPYGIYGVKPLQKIRMGFSQHVPLTHQPENYLIDGNVWQQHYSIGLPDLYNYLDQPNDIWGLDNRVQHSLITSGIYSVAQSLYLIQVNELRLYTEDNRRRASFTYNGIDYDLAVTDPRFDDIVENNQAVNQILCVSLGEEYQGYCYKLVAAVF